MMIAPPFPILKHSYIKYFGDLIHRKPIFNIDNKKTDVFFVWLKKVDGVDTLNNVNLSILIGKKLHIFSIVYSNVVEFEWGI